MGKLDEFTTYGRFTGSLPDHMSEMNLDEYLDKYGEKWVAGYLQAMETVCVDLSDILSPAKDRVSGISNTPHIVRKLLKEYWATNVATTKSLINKVSPGTMEKPSP
ncbi:hypothetical protein ABDD95_18660 [Mucilaginibacter sp. PAMB04274]|uniref:hypothetical protein n=1 Tax=Mucilaginibacter sp. PAMB04274 TaxID=3138568 RepID=UPI0031F66C49